MVARDTRPAVCCSTRPAFRTDTPRLSRSRFPSGTSRYETATPLLFTFFGRLAFGGSTVFLKVTEIVENVADAPVHCCQQAPTRDDKGVCHFVALVDDLDRRTDEIIESEVGQVVFVLSRVVLERRSLCGAGLSMKSSSPRMPYLPVKLPWSSIMPASRIAGLRIWSRPRARPSGSSRMTPHPKHESFLSPPVSNLANPSTHAGDRRKSSSNLAAMSGLTCACGLGWRRNYFTLGLLFSSRSS